MTFLATEVFKLVGTITLDGLNKVISGLERIEGEAKNTDNAFQRLGKGFVKVGSIAATLAGSVGLVGGAMQGLKFNAMMEQSEIAWETLLGGAEEAKQMIEDLKVLGAETPFEFEGLDDSAKLLKAMGFEGEQIIPTISILGDAVSAVGGGVEDLNGVARALGQINTKGKVTAEEMNQLIERGIPAWDLMARGMGKSTEELMAMSQKGELFAEEAIPAMVKGMNEDFGGAMERQSKSFIGMLSTIQDNANIILGDLFKPAFDYLSSTFLPKLLEVSNILEGGLNASNVRDAFATMLPESVTKRMDWVIAWFEALNLSIDNANWDNLGRGIGIALTQIFDGIQNMSGKLQAKLLEWFNSINWQAVADGAKEGIYNFAIVVAGYFSDDLADAIETKDPATIATALGSFIGKIIASLAQNVATWSASLTQLLISLIQAIDVGALSGVILAFALSLILGFVEALTDPVWWIQFLSENWETVLGLIIGLLFAPAKWIAKIGEALAKIPIVGRLLSWLFESFMKLLEPVRKKIKEVADAAWDGFKNGWTNTFGKANLWQYIKDAWQKFKDNLSNWWNGIINWIKGKADQLGRDMSNPFKTLDDKATSVAKSVSGKISGMIEKVKGWFNKLKLKFSISDIKTPHFFVRNWSWNPKNWINNPPSVGVRWYETGGIFDDASIIGVGEGSAREAVIPLEGRYMKPFADEIAKQMPGEVDRGGRLIEVPVYLDGREIARTIADEMDTSLARVKRFNQRGRGM